MPTTNWNDQSNGFVVRLKGIIYLVYRLGQDLWQTEKLVAQFGLEANLGEGDTIKTTWWGTNVRWKEINYRNFKKRRFKGYCIWISLDIWVLEKVGVCCVVQKIFNWNEIYAFVMYLYLFLQFSIARCSVKCRRRSIVLNLTFKQI